MTETFNLYPGQTPNEIKLNVTTKFKNNNSSCLRFVCIRSKKRTKKPKTPNFRDSLCRIIAYHCTWFKVKIHRTEPMSLSSLSNQAKKGWLKDSHIILHVIFASCSRSNLKHWLKKKKRNRHRFKYKLRQTALTLFLFV